MPKEISLPGGLKLSPLLAVYCREDDTLSIADLHLGYEASLQAEHVAIPRFQLGSMVERLEKLLIRFDPAAVVINGDMKHEFSRNKSQEWDEIDAVLDVLHGREVVAVRGNHDNFLQTILAQRDVAIADSYVVPQGNVRFSHGHRDAGAFPGLSIYAHEHPVIRLRDEVGASVQMPCFLYDEANRFMLMPAFSPLASGTDLSATAPSFMNPTLRELDISDAKVYAVHGDIMDFGKVSGLRALHGCAPDQPKRLHAGGAGV